MSSKIQIRRGLQADWISANPVLAQGEMAFEIDTCYVKVGDGVKTYNALPYVLSLVIDGGSA